VRRASVVLKPDHAASGGAAADEPTAPPQVAASGAAAPDARRRSSGTRRQPSLHPRKGSQLGVDSFLEEQRVMAGVQREIQAAEQKQKKDKLDKKLSSIQKHRNNILKCLEDRIDQRESDAALTSTLDSLYADTAAKRSAASASRGGEGKKQRVERQDTGPTSWVREWMMDRLCDAHSPGVLDETERDEIMAENERLEGPWDDFWAAVKKAGWTQPEFIRGKRQVKTLADKPRVELVESTSTTPTTRAGVDDDGSDSD
jgi:hypothetical protein